MTSGFLSYKANAANIKEGTNPPFVLQDFYSMYPQFEGLAELPEEVITMYVDFAKASINIDRWKNSWKIGMCLFIAHFCTLYIQSFTPAGSTAQEVIAAAQAKGLVTSKSVGDVSVNYDFSSAVNGLDGWANWTSTTFGINLANLGKLLGKGNMWIF